MQSRQGGGVTLIVAGQTVQRLHEQILHMLCRAPNISSTFNVMPETSNSHAILSGWGRAIDSSWPDWPVMAGANAIQSTVMHGQVPQPTFCGPLNKNQLT